MIASSSSILMPLPAGEEGATLAGLAVKKPSSGHRTLLLS
jgi:hypothetical protein